MKAKTKAQRLSNAVAKKLAEQYGTMWLIWDRSEECWGLSFKQPNASAKSRCPNCKTNHDTGWEPANSSVWYIDNKLAKVIGAEKGDCNKITIVLEHD